MNIYYVEYFFTPANEMVGPFTTLAEAEADLTSKGLWPCDQAHGYIKDSREYWSSDSIQFDTDARIIKKSAT